MENKKLVQRFERAHNGMLSCAAICTKQKKLLITGGGDNHVNIWLLTKPDPITILKGQNSAISCVTSHPKESYIAGGSIDGTIKLWDLAQAGKAVRTFGCVDGTACLAMEFHPLVDILAIMSSNHTVTLWDFRQRRCIKQIAPQPDVLSLDHNPLISPCLRFSPDGKWFCYSSISNDECLLHVWDLSSGKEIRTLSHPTDEGIICELLFHPHHMIMITGNASGNLRVWDMTTFRLLQAFAPLEEMNCNTKGIRMMFNTDGNLLLVYKGSYMERIRWHEGQLQSIDCSLSECKQIPSYIVVTGTSMLSLCCDTSSSFSLWVTNTTMPTVPPPSQTDANGKPPLADQTNIIESTKSTSKRKPKNTANLPIQPNNQKISMDRQSALFRLDIESFCNSILSTTPISSEDKLCNEIMGDKHKSFCATMRTRSKLLKPLSTLSKKEEILIPNILNIFARTKDIDLSTLSVAIATCTANLDSQTLQIEHISALNALLILLLDSSCTEFMDTALQCLYQVVQCYSAVIRTNRPNKLRESLQLAQQISQDPTAWMSLRVTARAACRAYTEKS